MKLRAITAFLAPTDSAHLLQLLDGAATFLAACRSKYEAAGYVVQTLRAATTSFEDWLDVSSPQAALRELQDIGAAMGKQGVIDFLSVGPALEHYEVVQATLTAPDTDKIFFLLPVGLTEDEVPDLDKAKQAADLVVAIAATSPAKVKDVPSCFRVTVTGNVGPGTPFFPGGYSAGPPGAPASFAVATENSDLVVAAWAAPGARGDLGEARRRLQAVLTAHLSEVEAVAKEASSEWAGRLRATSAGSGPASEGQALPAEGHLLGAVQYAGIDASIASAAGSAASLVRAYEAVGLGPFGGPGTLALSSLITGVVKRLPVKLCGYSGLMLPLTEDLGLAQRGSEGTVSVQTLLHYSAVCGCGIDTVPVSGETTAEELAVVFCDMVAMAFRLNKPLSARLWPVKGLRTGDVTEVDNPFFVNCKCLPVTPSGVKPLPSETGHQPTESPTTDNGRCLFDKPAGGAKTSADPLPRITEPSATASQGAGCTPNPVYRPRVLQQRGPTHGESHEQGDAHRPPKDPVLGRCPIA